jgi:hypothetical protein
MEILDDQAAWCVVSHCAQETGSQSQATGRAGKVGHCAPWQPAHVPAYHLLIATGQALDFYDQINCGAPNGHHVPPFV